MPATDKDHQGSALTTSYADIVSYTGANQTLLLTAVNDGASLRTVSVELVESAGSDGQSKLIAKLQIPANSSLTKRGPWFGAAGAKIRAKQDSGTDCTLRVTGQEIT